MTPRGLDRMGDVVHFELQPWGSTAALKLKSSANGSLREETSLCGRQDMANQNTLFAATAVVVRVEPVWIGACDRVDDSGCRVVRPVATPSVAVVSAAVVDEARAVAGRAGPAATSTSTDADHPYMGARARGNDR